MQYEFSKLKSNLKKKFNKIFTIVLIIIFFNFGIKAITWQDIQKNSYICLCAGDMRTKPVLADQKFIGLSLSKNDDKHILHNITLPFPIASNCVDIFQAEDVFEHIEYKKLINIINEIYRILKPGGLFRLSVPDYRCDVLIARSIKDKAGNIVFDPGGGGKYVNGKVIHGGHVWFPKIETVKKLLKQSQFGKLGNINYLHYYDTKGKSITKQIDYSQCYVSRTPDNDKRVKNPYRVMSIVVDLYK